MHRNFSAKAQEALLEYFSASRCKFDEATRWVYGYDNSRRQAMPSAVVFVKSHEEVLWLCRWANHYEVSLLPHGRGTATTGATVPLAESVVVSFEMMNQVLEFDPLNRFIRVQAGISNQAVQAYVKSSGLFWPPDPSSANFSSVGGNLACNAGGPKAVKYGTCRENTLGLKVVTGAGEEIETGGYTFKSSVAYDLTRLMIGSEGTLGFITEATLKLSVLPQEQRTLVLSFDELTKATDTILALLALPILPAAIEFLDEFSLKLIRSNETAAFHPLAKAIILLILEGDGRDIQMQVEACISCCQNYDPLAIDLAETEAEQAEVWRRRKTLSPLQRKIASHKINEDVVVPVSRLADLLSFVHQLAQDASIHVLVFGHAGSGNLHVNFLFDGEDVKQSEAAARCLDALFTQVILLRGCLSGEHGVGLDKQKYLKMAISPPTHALMLKIKQCFDPKGLLNPKKSIDFQE